MLDSVPPGDVDYRPARVPPLNPAYRPNRTVPRAAPGWLDLLWEQVGVHVGDVMLRQVPGSRWVCWRDKANRAITNGMPVINYGVPGGPFDALGRANADVLRSWTHLATGDAYDVRPDPGRMTEHFVASLNRRETYLADHPARWQSAPTGPRSRRSQVAPPTDG